MTTDLNEKQYLSPFQLMMSEEKEMDFGYTPPFYSLNFEIKMNKDKLRRHTGQSGFRRYKSLLPK